jgi:AcrR family transcriptional regulator
MRTARIDIRSIRQEQIVEAAVAVIAEQGLQNLSLSEIEKKAGMSRGQLTYYFHAKEDILLAVFDRLLQLMYERIGQPEGNGVARPGGLELVKHLLEKLLSRPPVSQEFHVLQYTFLSQIGHREDFRQRLARLYEEWRSHMAEDFAGCQPRLPSHRALSPRALATLIQSLIHGLAMQAAADPEAFDREEMIDLCLDVLRAYLKSEKLQPKMTHDEKQ